MKAVNIAAVWLKGSSMGAVQSHKVTKQSTMGEGFGKDWSLTGGAGAIWASRTSMKIVTLSLETQTKHGFKNRAPSSDWFMVHTPGPSHTISIYTLPFCCGVRALCWSPLAEPPDTQTCDKALEVTQNSYSNSSKQYPDNLLSSYHFKGSVLHILHLVKTT